MQDQHEDFGIGKAKQMREAMRRREARSDLIYQLIVAGIVVAIAALGVIGAALLYGDWRCFFIECRKIVP